MGDSDNQLCGIAASRNWRVGVNDHSFQHSFIPVEGFPRLLVLAFEFVR